MVYHRLVIDKALTEAVVAEVGLGEDSSVRSTSSGSASSTTEAVVGVVVRSIISDICVPAIFKLRVYETELAFFQQMVNFRLMSVKIKIRVRKIR